MTISYFSSDPVGSNFGLRRGTGGAKEGRHVDHGRKWNILVKTGIVTLAGLDEEKGTDKSRMKWPIEGR